MVVTILRALKAASTPGGMWLPRIFRPGDGYVLESFAVAPLLADVDHEVLLDDVPLRIEAVVPTGEARNVVERLEIGTHCHGAFRSGKIGVRPASGGPGILTLRFACGEPFEARYGLTGMGGVKIPDASFRARTMGEAEAEMFDFTGYGQALHLQDFYRAYGDGLERPARVLDWGVGCGRSARYLQRDLGGGFHLWRRYRCRQPRMAART